MSTATDKKVFLFESKFPGLQIHIEEVMVKQGKHEMRQNRAAVFTSQGGPATPATKSKGYYSTTDPQMAKDLREQRSFGKDFTEVTKA